MKSEQTVKNTWFPHCQHRFFTAKFSNMLEILKSQIYGK